MSAIFFKSKNVNIFPCARRGIYREAGSDKDNIYNPESRFVSEANLTKLSGLAFGRDSYIISRPTTVSEGGIWKLFIKGYYFELTIEKDELQEEGYFIIGLEDTEDISHIRLAALKESSDSLISINKGATSLDADGSCRAICFISSVEEPSGKDLYCVHSEGTLENLDKSYANLSMSETLSGIDARLDVIEGEGEGSVEKALADAQAYADSLAANYDAAGAAADVASDLSEHVADNENPHKVTKAQVGLGNVDNKSVNEIKNEFTGSVADGNDKFVTGEMVFDAIAAVVGDVISNDPTAQTVEGAKRYAKQLVDDLTGTSSGGETEAPASLAREAELRIAADKALKDRLDTVEAELTNVSNVMDFVGAAEALPAEGNNQSGDVIVITAGDDAGKEFVYDDSREAGKKWVEFGSTSATDAAVAGLKSRMDAAESDIDQAQVDILALGTNKMDKSAFNTWEEGFEADKAAHENGHAKEQAEITADIATAKSEAITEAGKLDTALHTEISKEIDADVKAAIDAEVIRANGAYDATGSAATAEQNAKDYADSQDRALKTAIEGTGTDASYVATIAGAKKYAEEKATEAATSLATDVASNYLSKTDVKGNKLGIYAVAFDLGGNLEELSSDFKAATSRPIVFISECSTLPSPPEGYAWFDSPNEDAQEVKTIDTNIILYLKKINSPEEEKDSEDTPVE